MDRQDQYATLEQRTARLKTAIRIAFANNGFELSMAERDLEWLVDLAEKQLEYRRRIPVLRIEGPGAPSSKPTTVARHNNAPGSVLKSRRKRV
jgi:hypothetical protein